MARWWRVTGVPCQTGPVADSARGAGTSYHTEHVQLSHTAEVGDVVSRCSPKCDVARWWRNELARVAAVVTNDIRVARYRPKHLGAGSAVFWPPLRSRAATSDCLSWSCQAVVGTGHHYSRTTSCRRRIEDDVVDVDHPLGRLERLAKRPGRALTPSREGRCASAAQREPLVCVSEYRE